MSEFERRLSPENSFENDYINEFVGLDLYLQGLKKYPMDLKASKDLCAQIFNRKSGKNISKFREKYGNTVPKIYEEKIKEIDILVDKTNAWLEEFLEDENSRSIDELAGLVKEAMDIIKSVRVKKK